VSPEGCLGVCDQLEKVIIGAVYGLAEVEAGARVPAALTSPGNTVEDAVEGVQRVTAVAKSGVGRFELTNGNLIERSKGLI
jgi:hypothetical protein